MENVEAARAGISHLPERQTPVWALLAPFVAFFCEAASVVAATSLLWLGSDGSSVAESGPAVLVGALAALALGLTARSHILTSGLRYRFAYRVNVFLSTFRNLSLIGAALLSTSVLSYSEIWFVFFAALVLAVSAGGGLILDFFSRIHGNQYRLASDAACGLIALGCLRTGDLLASNIIMFAAGLVGAAAYAARLFGGASALFPSIHLPVAPASSSNRAAFYTEVENT